MLRREDLGCGACRFETYTLLYFTVLYYTIYYIYSKTRLYVCGVSELPRFYDVAARTH